MSAPSASTSSRAASGSMRTPASCAVATVQRIASSSFTRASSTMPQCSPSVSRRRSKRFLSSISMRRLSEGMRRKVRNENQQSLRIRRSEIAIQRSKLLFFRAACIELPHVAHEDHLKRRHQRRRLCAVEHLKDRSAIQVHVRQAEVSQVWRDKSLEHGSAAAIEQESLIARQHIARPA